MLDAEPDDRTDIVRVERRDEHWYLRLELPIERLCAFGIPLEKSATREVRHQRTSLFVGRAEDRTFDGGSELVQEGW